MEVRSLDAIIRWSGYVIYDIRSEICYPLRPTKDAICEQPGREASRSIDELSRSLGRNKRGRVWGTQQINSSFL